MPSARLPPASSVLATLSIASTRPVTGLAAQPGAEGVAGQPGVGRYRILRTDEVDAKDTPLAPEERANIAATGLAAATRHGGDDFVGTARKAAKLSISDAAPETFDAVAAIVATLPSKSDMVHHSPRITDGPGSERVTEEQRNVSLLAFLYAASRENDNDFHLIVGQNPQGQEEVYMTMEVSGLPSPGGDSFTKLKSTRDSFQGFFGDKLPGASYDFYDPPIPIRVGGSLFFDMSHANGQSPGPPTLHPHMPVIWEVHPVTNIEFEPGTPNT